MAIDDPIFIHSLFREAGCYFLEKFRDLGPAYACYRDPFGAGHGQYFVPDAAPLPAAQLTSLSALLWEAPGRPVLQLRRSAGRMQALRRHFRGIHIHLWHEPRAQWWSCRIAAHFDRSVRRIYAAPHLPEALRRTAATVELGAHTGRPLDPADNYRLFYALWLDAWLRLCAHANLTISLDHLTTSRFQNLRCCARLSELTGCAIDLSDARSRGLVLTREEEAFYAEQESAVNDVFIASGCASAQDIQNADAAARGAREAHEAGQHDLATERNLRLATLTMMRAMARQRPNRLQRHARALASLLRNCRRVRIGRPDAEASNQARCC